MTCPRCRNDSPRMVHNEHVYDRRVLQEIGCYMKLAIDKNGEQHKLYTRPVVKWQ